MKTTSRAMLAAAAVILALIAGAPDPLRAQSAGNPSAEAIIEALRSTGTRGVTAAPAAPSPEATPPAGGPDDEAFLAELWAKASRGLSVNEKERTRLVKVAAARRAIDLEVLFDFNAAIISERSRPVVMALGKALSSPELAGGTFMIAGHTDAKGKAAYNQDLSERRAMAVKQFLIDEFKLPADRLVVAGYGAERLKKPKEPYADENRRVEVINMTPSVASR